MKKSANSEAWLFKFLYLFFPLQYNLSGLYWVNGKGTGGVLMPPTAEVHGPLATGLPEQNGCVHRPLGPLHT